MTESTQWYRHRATGTVLRAETTPRKIAVYWPWPEHCGQPSWMTRVEFRKAFQPVYPCAQVAP